MRFDVEWRSILRGGRVGRRAARPFDDVDGLEPAAGTINDGSMRWNRLPTSPRWLCEQAASRCLKRALSRVDGCMSMRVCASQ